MVLVRSGAEARSFYPNKPLLRVQQTGLLERYIEEGDWLALADSFLGKTFNPAICSPLVGSDNRVQLEVSLKPLWFFSNSFFPFNLYFLKDNGCDFESRHCGTAMLSQTELDASASGIAFTVKPLE